MVRSWCVFFGPWPNKANYGKTIYHSIYINKLKIKPCNYNTPILTVELLIKIMRCVMQYKKNILIIILFSFFACSSGNNGQNNGSPPVIHSATNFYQFGANYVETADRIFKIGSYVRYELHCSDEDKDVTGAWVTEYLWQDGEYKIFQGPRFDEFPQQENVDFYMVPENGVEQIVGPAGEYKIERQLEDSKGNLSNLYTTFGTIIE